MKFYTRLETALMKSIFKMDTELHCHSLLPFLLMGKSPTGNLALKRENNFTAVSQLPLALRSRFDEETVYEITRQVQYQSYESSEAFQMMSFENYFYDSLKRIFKYHEYTGLQPLYAQFDFLSTDDVEEKAKLQAVISVMLHFYRDNKILTFMFNHFQSNYFNVDIPLTSTDALRKYLSRKEKEGFPNCLIHGLINQPSNNRELTALMKDVLVVLATNNPMAQSADIIKEDLDHMLNNNPVVAKGGIYSVSSDKISKFLNSPEAKSMISYAKDEPNEFRRKFTGIFRFSRASAPLVRICIDGYSFQLKVKNETTGSPDSLIGIFIEDDNSDCVLSLAIGDSENTELLMEAFKDYFIRTAYSLPREIVIDKHCFIMLKRNKNLMNLFKRYGTKLTVSSNPNRKNIERFFLTFQQRFLTHIIQYIGPGIKATKRKNAHPFRSFLIMLNKNLKSKYDLIPMLKRVVLNQFNKEYKKYRYLETPEKRFDDAQKNAAIVLPNGPELMPILFYELHNATVRGASILLRNTVRHTSDNYHFYYKRDFDFIKTYSGVKLKVYVDSNDWSTIYLYENTTNKFICSLAEYIIIPVAEFDRSDQQKDDVRKFNKETRNLFKIFDEELNQKRRIVTLAIGGRDINKLTKAAAMKKEESSDEVLRREMELKDQRPEPKMFDSNKGRRRFKHKTALSELGIEITSTI